MYIWIISDAMSKTLPDHPNEIILCSVMSTVVYFDIFKHPLTKDEIFEYTHNLKFNSAELEEALNFLTSNGFLFFETGYYLPHQKFENISRRENGKTLAEYSWDQAVSKSILISKFPYVRSVVISGSLSKGYMDKTSDIDFLIITKPGRLWLTRSLLAFYKKIFLFNSHKLFCVNYFLDLNNLKLPDDNLFIATELLFAVPVYNPEVHYQFVDANSWSKNYYPAIKPKTLKGKYEIPPDPTSKKFLEKLLNGKIGALLDKSLMKLTVSFWQKKFKTMNKTQYNRDMKSTEGVSKHHPNGFRDRVLREHEKQLNIFKNKLTEVLVST